MGLGLGGVLSLLILFDFVTRLMILIASKLPPVKEK